MFLDDHGTSGAEIYERFGHNAIWIRDSAAKIDRVYNYGMFSWEDSGFLRNFIMGRPRYILGVSDLEHTIAQYQFEQRSLDVQELNLPPALRADLARRLAENALETNRTYTYDYFRDNCSTRVRDMLNTVLGGVLRRATFGKPAEGTLRFHTLRSITNNKLLFVGIDAGLGPTVDRPIDQWSEMFLPQKVQERVRELRLPGADGGVPLVAREARLLDIAVYHVDPSPPQWDLPLLAIACLLAIIIGTGALRGTIGIPGRVVGGTWLLVMGLGGVLLLFLWLATNHVATAWNRNLFFFSPIALFVLPGFWYRKGKVPPPWTLRAPAFLVISVVIGAIFAVFQDMGGQQIRVIAELTGLPTMAASIEALRTLTIRRSLAPSGSPE